MLRDVSLSDSKCCENATVGNNGLKAFISFRGLLERVAMDTQALRLSLEGASLSHAQFSESLAPIVVHCTAPQKKVCIKKMYCHCGIDSGRRLIS